MEKSEATHLAVGATLLGVGGVALSIVLPLAASTKPHPWTSVWFLAAFSVAAIMGLLGSYVLCAVYTGWPLPSTASERAARQLEKELSAHIGRGQHLYYDDVRSDEQLDAFRAAYLSWKNDVIAWLVSRISESKAREFANPHGMAASVPGSYNSDHNDIRLRISWHLEILMAIPHG